MSKADEVIAEARRRGLVDDLPETRTMTFEVNLRAFLDATGKLPGSSLVSFLGATLMMGEAPEGLPSLALAMWGFKVVPTEGASTTETA